MQYEMLCGPICFLRPLPPPKRLRISHTILLFFLLPISNFRTPKLVLLLEPASAHKDVCAAHSCTRLPAGKPTTHGSHTQESRAPQPKSWWNKRRAYALHGHPSHGYPPPPPPVSSCSCNRLGAEGATALASGLTALTKLQSIDVR
jgi:hypothetical protein